MSNLGLLDQRQLCKLAKRAQPLRHSLWLMALSHGLQTQAIEEIVAPSAIVVGLGRVGQVGHGHHTPQPLAVTVAEGHTTLSTLPVQLGKLAQDPCKNRVIIYGCVCNCVCCDTCVYTYIYMCYVKIKSTTAEIIRPSTRGRSEHSSMSDIIRYWQKHPGKCKITITITEYKLTLLMLKPWLDICQQCSMWRAPWHLLDRLFDPNLYQRFHDD